MIFIYCLFFLSSFFIIESKNQEVPEQDANGGAKTDLTAIQNHNLLIALAHHGGATGSPFAMPVSSLNYSTSNFKRLCCTKGFSAC